MLCTALLPVKADTTASGSPDIGDALEILRYLAKLPSDYDDSGISPTINDALCVLKVLAKLEVEEEWVFVRPHSAVTESGSVTESVTTTTVAVTTTAAVTTTTAVTTTPAVTTTTAAVTTTPAVTTTTVAVTTTTTVKETGFVPAVMDLSADIFKRSFAESFESNKSSVLVSPLSLMVLLAMAANGADGLTLAEMESLLGGEMPFDEFNASLSDYAKNLPSSDGAKFNMGNSIWLNSGMNYSLNEDFVRTVGDNYGAEVASLPFDEDAVKQINDWVDKNTDGFIPEIIGDISPDELMYLINALAFDADWEKQYDKVNVSKRDFKAADGRIQNVDFMFSHESMYISADNATGFLKPYKDGKYSFAAILPNAQIKIQDFISGLTGESLFELLNSAAKPAICGYAETLMPKFSFEYEIEMSKILSSMGMSSAFSSLESNFTKMFENGNAVIEKVMHKTLIEVDEKGTRAASSSTIVMTPPWAPPRVVLDRPFVFAIIDNSTNIPMFVGAVLSVYN